MPNVTPLHESVQHHLGNAAQIAEFWAHFDRGAVEHPVADAFAAIRDHLKAALEQLGEPNLAAIQATATMLGEVEGRLPVVMNHREWRDIAAVILRAQVTGNVPPTWSAE